MKTLTTWGVTGFPNWRFRVEFYNLLKNLISHSATKSGRQTVYIDMMILSLLKLVNLMTSRVGVLVLRHDWSYSIEMHHWFGVIFPNMQIDDKKSFEPESEVYIDSERMLLSVSFFKTSKVFCLTGEINSTYIYQTFPFLTISLI